MLFVCLFWEEIVNLYNQGYHTKKIYQNLKVTERTVRNILDHFRRYGIVNPLAVGGSQVSVMNADLLEVIEIWKLQKASIYATEIQSRLLLEGICTLDKLPSITPTFDIWMDATVGWLCTLFSWLFEIWLSVWCHRLSITNLHISKTWISQECPKTNIRAYFRPRWKLL